MLVDVMPEATAMLLAATGWVALSARATQCAAVAIQLGATRVPVHRRVPLLSVAKTATTALQRPVGETSALETPVPEDDPALGVCS